MQDLPAFVGKASPNTGQTRVAKTELKNKCGWIPLAVPRSLLSFTATDPGLVPHSVPAVSAVFYINITAQAPMLSPPTSGNTDILMIREDHTRAACLSLPIK